MKPIKLQFKGINSFSEYTEIDFEKLTGNGIFGIFGDTGSGKSTILDCINFALYGKVERSKEKLDIINYRSDSAEVGFEFDVLSEGKRKKYFVERSLKKKSGLHKAMLYEDGNCVADNATTVTKKITEILGVDAEDFRKCIALPQGEFSQFVKSQPSERIALIERLFSLYKYGDRLKERLKERETQAEINYTAASTKLGAYAAVSAEAIKTLETQIAEEKEKTENLLKVSAAAEKNYAELKLLGEKSGELSEAEKRLAELASRKQEMDELKAGLKAAPVCKTVVETNDEIVSQSLNLKNAESELVKTENLINSEQRKIERINLQLSNGKYEEKIEERIALSVRYGSCESKTDKLSEIQKQLESKRAEFGAKKEKLGIANQKLKSAERAVEAARGKIDKCTAPDIDKLINVYFKGAVLKDEYVGALDYFVGLNGQVKFFKDDSELYGFISRELKNQIDLYKERVYRVKDFDVKEAERQLKNVQSASKERELLSNELNVKSVELKDARFEADAISRELDFIFREGEELKKQAEEIKAELKEIFGQAENFNEVKAENESQLSKLRSEKARLSDEAQTANKNLAELNARLAAQKVEAEKTAETVKTLKLNFNSLLEKSGFDNLEACKRVAAEFEKFTDAEKALEDYRAECASVNALISKLEKTDGIKNFSVKELQDAESEKNRAAAEVVAEREKLAVYVSDLKSLKEKSKEKKALQAELALADKDRNLVAQLKELTKGNKFMEYIANEYLYDISALASSTLLNLTDGRYYLTYTDNFYAGDNFDCGNLRGVNTMSGGETFLVSLSLALALSQTICSSLKSIEFFFLDEGFGTLDSNLIDTVMNALEKLKSSNFTIGIISHVEELKHRIDNKITVSKATESHGSSVQLSC